MKRKLKDLKENECIKVNTLAQAKYFIEKFRWEKVNPTEIVGRHILVDTTEGRRYFWCESLKPKNEYPASDFIKPKKSGMKQAVKELREACKELAETQQKTNEYLEVLNGRPQATIEYVRIDAPDSSKMEHTELEVGKWYKHRNGNDLCFREGESGNFGFINDEWRKNIHCTNVEEWIEATPEEVEKALIKEAGVRFKYGITVKVDGEKDSVKLLLFKEYKYEPSDNTLYWCVDNLRRIPLFKNGNWAEIISEEQTIDWSKPGQLVELSRSGDVFMVLGKGTSLNYDSFEAVCIKQSDIYFLGEHSTTFDCTQFKPYNGTITLKND